MAVGTVVEVEMDALESTAEAAVVSGVNHIQETCALVGSRLTTAIARPRYRKTAEASTWRRRPIIVVKLQNYGGSIDMVIEVAFEEKL